MAGRGRIRVQSLPNTAMEHNASCSLYVGTDGEDADMDFLLLDHLHVQYLCHPMRGPFPRP